MPQTYPHSYGILQRVQNSDTEAVREWLWQRAELQDSGCQVWTGRTDRHGYPKATKRGHAVHRLVFQAWHGEVPAGFQVHHMCGNRLCLNPQHLSADPASRNSAEMLERRAYQERIAILEAALEAAKVEIP